MTRISYAFIFTVILFAITACSKSPQMQSAQGFAQGTDYHIQWWSKNKTDTTAIKKAFATTLAQIDKELSTYRNDSYISQFNHSGSTQWQPASKDFIALLEIAKTINQQTQGCYDPTIGPLFDLWGFHGNNFKVPTAAQISAVKAEIGFDKLEIDAKNLKIRKKLPKLALDLSSMGEGYTIYKLSHVLESFGIRDYLIEFGGDMKIRGHKPNGQHWRIAIQNPKTKQPTVYQVVTINDDNHQGVTLDTSGTYRHYFDKNGKRYSHILDPRTGSPVTHNLISASVFGKDPRVSDAWATAMLCLGEKPGLSISDKLKLNTFFIQEDTDGKLFNTKSAAIQKDKQLTFN